jgi:hypothetical protein
MAAALAEEQRRSAGIPERNAGRPRGRSAAFRELERRIDPDLPDQEISREMRSAGLVVGDFAPADAYQAESNYQLVKRVKRHARRARSG